MEKARRPQEPQRSAFAHPDHYPPILDILVPESDSASGILYLGDPELIDAMLRGFLTKAIEAQIEDQTTGTQTVQLVMAQEAQKCAKIVLGLDSDYVVISPQWNGTGLLEAVKRRWNLTDGNAFDIAAIPFYALVQAYTVAMELEMAGQPWQHVINGAIELSTAVLMGTESVMTL